MTIKLLIKKLFIRGFQKLTQGQYIIANSNLDLHFITNSKWNSSIDALAKLYNPYKVNDSTIGAYTYVGVNSNINLTNIGRFCSIGPNFSCGLGIHPTNGISTAPMFYSCNTSNGISLSSSDKIDQRKRITIGNDVWIGINVTILDGVSIGDGAVIAAGAVVTKDVQDYAIYAGVPAKFIKYRFDTEQIFKLKKISWWNFELKDLQNIERYFFEVDTFIDKYTL